jgi:hypothetical protein
LSNINYQLQYNAEGFLNKDKLRIIIDSVDPTSTNPGVLLPAEDYSLVLSTSNPIKSFSISGMLIQKSEGAWIIRGYDKFKPYFTVFEPIHTLQDTEVRVGGSAESYVTWTEGKFYQTGQVVTNNNKWYRTVSSHTATAVFDSAKFYQLPAVPTTGGVTAARSKQWTTEAVIIPYGTRLYSIQAVFDFILGYGEWLKSLGFVFDFYQETFGEVIDWDFNAKEFLFWTSQNWSDGSLITLSPFAEQLKFSNTSGTGNAIYGVVDNLQNNFYEYSLLTADGTAYPTTGFILSREDDGFSVTTTLKNIGLYFAQFNIVQKQHSLIFNNFSLFNDIIYDVETGYRQRRVKLIGFRSANWTGNFSSPGFIYDNAEISDWQEYKDYDPGDVVRYSGTYYGAIERIYGTSTFDFTKWNLLPDTPVAQLLPNFDYKINQFEDFYSLDIDNFDLAQQRMAQHLTGYTPRNYLDNIFNDPIAQYKFYQGYIREKGTANAINKLAKASLNNLKGEISFNETWAVRAGYYGGYNTYQELEVNLDDSKFVQNPQVIQFTDYPQLGKDFVYRKPVAEVLIKPEDYDYNSVFPTVDTPFEDYVAELPQAGYVRLDDVTATAYNTNSLLDIGNVNDIQEGATFWTGFKENGSWDVLRYTRLKVRIVDFQILTPGSNGVFTTNVQHGLSVGDLVAVSRFIPDVCRVYTVTSIPTPDTFVASTALTNVPYSSTIYIGQLFKFVSVRFNSFDDLRGLPRLTTTLYGDKIWVDNDGTGNFGVYEKIDNYSNSIITDSINNKGQLFGYKTSLDDSTSTYAVSAPFYNDINVGKGRVFVYERLSSSSPNANSILSFGLNDTEGSYFSSNIVPQFGESVIYDKYDDIVFAGAPYASNIKVDSSGTVRYARFTNSTNSRNNCGLVKISAIDRNNIGSVTLAVIASPSPTANGLFGKEILSSQTSTNKTLLVSAPGENKVYNFNITMGEYNTSTLTISAGTPIVSNLNVNTARFGSSISGNSDLSIVVVGAPGYSYDPLDPFADIDTGIVNIYTATNSGYVLSQSITKNSTGIVGTIDSNSQLGDKVIVSKDSNYLFISAPGARYGTYQGIVSVWKRNGYTYNWLQNITNPNQRNTVVFGVDLSIDTSKETLAISSLGDVEVSNTTFDLYSELLPNALAIYGSKYVTIPSSTPKKLKTTFDSNSTRFHSVIKNAGTVSVFNRTTYGNYFAYAQDLVFLSVRDNSNFGFSVNQWNENLYVGAPTSDVSGIGENNGELVVFQKKDSSINSWALIRSQEPLVSIDAIKKILTIDISKDQVTDYLEIIDPVKGKIAGAADQELDYKTLFDPAIYSLGITGVNVNSDTNWIDDHIGELWWDLSTIKYMWYEQGDLDYRKNNWGNVFPGSSVNVYEWVSSRYLPSEWASLADTNEGLAKGISGQPKYPDNSIMSVKQIYNSTSNLFTNVYYFWVKNKSTIPNNASKPRRLSSLGVAGLIADPKGQNVKHVNFLSANALSLVNIKDTIQSNNINLHINIDTIKDSAPRHTEWALLQEGDVFSMPPVMLEQKMIDSLVGYDPAGNLVPDPALSPQMRYGISIRPRQSMFVSRANALRNLITWTNSILIKNRITKFSSFNTLNSYEPIPDADLNEYDQLVEDNYALGKLNTFNLYQATLACTVDTNGKVNGVAIVDSGRGYNPLYPPTVEVMGNGEGAVIKTTCDEEGRVIGAIVVEGGLGYSTIPQLVVRPYTVIVSVDSEANNLWSKFQWSIADKKWIRVHTQQYDTRLYWDLIDWQDPTYNALQDFATTVGEPYELQSVSVSASDYVKVKNAGNGTYMIVRKTATGTVGTWDADWDVVYEEHGTIKFADRLWDDKLTDYGFDEIAAYDQTLYDQSANAELIYILNAIKNDLFVGPLKIYWNTFFFKAIKFALQEQKSLDWAFKTSYLDVINHAGNLDQRPTYKLQNSSYYEKWINEVKPYHSKIRNFTVAYTSTDVSSMFTSDFDLSPYYDQSTDAYSVISTSTNLLLSTYPYKAWADNYTNGVTSIDVVSTGSGYVSAPVVKIIPAPNDTGAGATAEAYISLGHVVEIVVKTPGTGYKLTPTVLLEGGYDSSTINKADTTATPFNFIASPTLNVGTTYTLSIPFDQVQVFVKTDFYDTRPLATSEFYVSGTSVVITTSTTSTANISINAVTYNNNNDLGYVKARAYAKLSNDKVRSLATTLKFDRISRTAEVLDLNAFDDFVCDGAFYTYVLTWPPQPDRSTIKVKNEGRLLLNDTFTIKYYTGDFVNTNGMTYKKKYAKLILNFVPEKNTHITIEYLKDVSLLNAIDRIDNYYTPLPGMPGVGTDSNGNPDYDQLLKGMSFGGVTVDTLPFNYATGWDQFGKQGWWTGAWDSYSSEENYGVVTDPQEGLSQLLISKLAELNVVNDQISFWQYRVIQVPSQLSGTPPFTIINNQYLPNSAYEYLLEQLGISISQSSQYQTQATALTTEIDNLQAGLVPVITPFDVIKGTLVNVYLNNQRVDIDSNTATTQTIHGLGTTSTVYIPLTSFSTVTSNTVVFRDQTSDGTLLPSDPTALDTQISGGELDNLFLGIAPSDVVLDGSSFINSDYSYAPEELLPGQIQESVAISVFEQKPKASPLIVSKKYQLDGFNTNFNIGGKVASTASVLVSTSTQNLRYNIDYYIDVLDNSITLTSPLNNGWLNITNMSVGGTGLLDSQAVISTGVTSTTIISVASLVDINDVYVTVNGIETKNYTLDKAPGYKTKKKAKAALTVPHSNATSEVQAWFFNAPAKAYSQVHEQIFTSIGALEKTFTLDQPPGIVEPLHSQVIVEFNGVRLQPPATVYFTVEENQIEFDVALDDKPLANLVDLSTTDVYRNGTKLVRGVDFRFESKSSKIIFEQGFLSTGDALAITILIQHQYTVVGNTLTLINVPRTGTDTMRVVTFTNHDASMIRKERFSANQSGQYRMERAVGNTSYIWVEYNGKSLMKDQDYSIAKDLKTVQLRQGLYEEATDKVVIMSIDADSYAGPTGYRMFTDLLGRTSYKRISAENTTKLAQPLLASDINIYVEDASVLTQPYSTNNFNATKTTVGTTQIGKTFVISDMLNVGVGMLVTGNPNIPVGTIITKVNTVTKTVTINNELLDALPSGTRLYFSYRKNLPGIIYVAGERIEFYTVNNNKLSQLRRGTLGTGILDGVPAGTLVIDQGTSQNMPVIEETIIERFVSTVSTNVYTATAITLSDLAPYYDQFEIRYGGSLLLKPTNDPIFITDTSIAPDSGQANALGVLNTSTVTPQFTVSSVIISNATYPVIHFDFDVQPGVEITLSKRTGTVFENTPVASFLSEKPSVLPVGAYYIGDPIITLETDELLTDEEGNPLEGI